MKCKNQLLTILVGLALTAWACQKSAHQDEQPFPASQDTVKAPPKVDRGPQMGPIISINVQINLNARKQNCDGGFGWCGITFGDTDISTNIRVQPKDTDPTKYVVRMDFQDLVTNPGNEMFEVDDPDAFQVFASDLGYTQIEIEPGDYSVVYVQGTTVVDYVDIPVSVLN